MKQVISTTVKEALSKFTHDCAEAETRYISAEVAQRCLMARYRRLVRMSEAFAPVAERSILNRAYDGLVFAGIARKSADQQRRFEDEARA